MGGDWQVGAEALRYRPTCIFQSGVEIITFSPFQIEPDWGEAVQFYYMFVAE